MFTFHMYAHIIIYDIYHYLSKYILIADNKYNASFMEFAMSIIAGAFFSAFRELSPKASERGTRCGYAVERGKIPRSQQQIKTVSITFIDTYFNSDEKWKCF